MTVNPKANKGDTNVNCISRSQGTGKVGPVYYSPKAPKNQPAKYIGKQHRVSK